MTYLFEIGKTPLVLEQEDPGIASDDPLDIFLLRRGWKLSRVRELQESISAKMTVDMFTGETKSLDAQERYLQECIDVYLKRLPRGE